MLVPRQSGFSLLEVLLAMTLGNLVLWGLVMMLQSQLSAARQVSERYYLRDQLLGVMDVMRRDSRCAGFNGAEGHSAHFADRETVIVTAAHQFGYVYRRSAMADQYQHVIYRLQGKQLLLCEKQTTQWLSWSEAMQSTVSTPCYGVFDGQRITVTNFDVQFSSVRAVGVRSGYVTVTLTVSLMAHPSVTESMTIAFVPRNWLP